jgi:hypothetical protein
VSRENFEMTPARFFAMGTKKAPPEGGAEVGRHWREGEAPAGGENDEKVAVE